MLSSSPPTRLPLAEQKILIKVRQILSQILKDFQNFLTSHEKLVIQKAHHNFRTLYFRESMILLQVVQKYTTWKEKLAKEKG